MDRAEKVSEAYKKRLVAAMKARGYSNHRLAKEAGISAQAIYGYIEGIRLPRLDYLMAISKTLGVSLDWLAGRSGTKRSAWISVRDRLPENNDEVLTTYIYDGNQKKRYVETGSYWDDGEGEGHWNSVWDEYRVGNAKKEVIAWMPMPKPPEEG